MRNYRLSDLVDPATVQKLAVAHYNAGGIPVGIIDAFDNSILVAAGWQDVCTLFHRAHPDSLDCCRESDNYIKSRNADGVPCQYKCKNGLWDIGIPVMVEGRHMATVFLGQFFYEGENPDREFFVRQARKFRYDPEKYLAALDRVPRFSREKVEQVLAYNKALAAIIADIAERTLLRLQAEELLRESVERFRVLSDTSSAAIFIYQGNKIVRANAAAEKLTGYTENELLKMNFWDWVHDGFKETARSRGLAIQRGEQIPPCYEFKYLTSNGEERWAYLSAGRTEYRRKPAVIAMVLDITERKHVEEALELSQFCIDKASVGIFQISEYGNIRSVNEHACRSLGYTMEELCSMTLFDIDPTFTREIFIEHRKMLCSSGSRTFETMHRRKDGSIFPVQITVNYLEFRGRKFTVSFAEDITERRRAEDQIKASLLEKEVLLKEIHHRVKNNLQIISALLELQSESIPNGKTRSAFRESQDRIKSMALVHQKLYMSEDLAQIDFAGYIKSLTDYLYRAYEGETDRIRMSFDLEGVSLGIDEAVPCGLLVNELVSNSLKHACPDCRKGEISVSLCESDDGLVTIEISDNGVGLPSGLDFHDSETLGLQLVNMLTRQLGGEIDINGDEGVSIMLRFKGGRRESLRF